MFTCLSGRQAPAPIHSQPDLRKTNKAGGNNAAEHSRQFNIDAELPSGRTSQVGCNHLIS